MQQNAPSGHTGDQEPTGQGHRTCNTTHGAGRHTGEQEPSGQGHRTGNRAHRVGTPVSESREAKDSERMRHNTTNRAGTAVNRIQVTKDTAQKAHRAGTPVHRSQVAKDTAHATQHTKRAHW